MTASLYLFFLSIMAVFLSIRVVLIRRRLKIGIGEGDSREMKNAIRLFGNFIEYVPLALILIVCCEIRHAPSWTIHALGISLCTGRVLHAYGLRKTIGKSFGRTLGMGLTYSTLFFGGLYLLVDWVRTAIHAG